MTKRFGTEFYTVISQSEYEDDAQSHTYRWNQDRDWQTKEMAVVLHAKGIKGCCG